MMRVRQGVGGADGLDAPAAIGQGDGDAFAQLGLGTICDVTMKLGAQSGADAADGMRDERGGAGKRSQPQCAAHGCVGAVRRRGVGGSAGALDVGMGSGPKAGRKHVGWGEKSRDIGFLRVFHNFDGKNQGLPQ